MSSCDCHIEIRDASQKKVLLILLSINAFMFVAELVVGLIAQSTGVLADSLDMLADALVYGVSLYAVGRGSSIKTRVAFLSGGFQVFIAFGILTDIVRRAITGSDPSSLLMFIVSCVALVANSYCLRLISKEKEGEVHMRASYIFSKNDVLANLGVILASILIYFTDSRWPDLIIGMVITILVLRGGIQIIKDAKKQNQFEADSSLKNKSLQEDTPHKRT
ncbi:MAG: cation diffusion facilitator family transporter [Akkermansiaceae bacterium]